MAAPRLNKQLQIKPQIASLKDHFDAVFDEMHANPGLAFQEETEKKLIRQELERMGLSYTSIGGGIVAHVEGETSSAGPMIGLTADMDALPMDEDPEGKDIYSKVDGAAHTCGHDGHSVSLLMAAEYLHNNRDFDGTAVLIWRPAEETGQGVQAMLDDGLLGMFPLDEVYGYHNSPDYPLGFGAVSAGKVLSSLIDFEITISGRGGHAGTHNVPMKERALNRATRFLQMHYAHIRDHHSVFLREEEPMREGRVCVNISDISTDSKAVGVLPTQVCLSGTMRTLTTGSYVAAMEGLHAAWRQVNEGSAKGFHLELDDDLLPVLTNDAEQTDVARGAMRAVLGRHFKVHAMPQQSGSDDFARFPVPKAYFALTGGDRNADHPHSKGLHNPNYIYNKDLLPIAASVYAEIIEQRLGIE